MDELVSTIQICTGIQSRQKDKKQTVTQIYGTPLVHQITAADKNSGTGEGLWSTPREAPSKTCPVNSVAKLGGRVQNGIPPSNPAVFQLMMPKEAENLFDQARRPAGVGRKDGAR